MMQMHLYTEHGQSTGGMENVRGVAETRQQRAEKFESKQLHELWQQIPKDSQHPEGSGYYAVGGTTDGPSQLRIDVVWIL